MRPGQLQLAAILAAIVTFMPGCGGGSHAVRTSAGPYRWLIETQGPQPTVAEENANPGTRAWRLPGPAAYVGGLAHGSLSGYVARQAAAPGQLEKVYVSAPGASRIRIRVFRMGWYGGTGGREVLVSSVLPAIVQPPCTHRAATGFTECDWHASLSFTIPSALPSGVYIVKLSARTGESDCLFVVRASRPQPLIAQLPTSTYEAYNAWGGNGLYPGGTSVVWLTGTTQGIEVSYDRPYDSVTGAGQFFARDVAMIRFLERYGYPASYTTSESVAQDPAQLLGHRAVIDFGHSEYWSRRQVQAFKAAFYQGTSLLFFSSDTLGWRVRYAPASQASSEAGAPDHSIVAHREYLARNPSPMSPTGIFADRGASLAGSAYLGCITPRLRVSGPPVYRYYSWSPAPGLKPAWLFAHTGVTARTTIPGIVGYEVDKRTPATPAGTKLIGGGSVTCMPSRAAEPGEPTPGPGDDVAETTLYTASSGAVVFDTGTLGWELGLEPVPSASPDAPPVPDPRLVAMTRNLLAHALGRAGA